MFNEKHFPDITVNDLEAAIRSLMRGREGTGARIREFGNYELWIAGIPHSSFFIHNSLYVFAPGKIILSGEYAVLFGFPGVAVPSRSGWRLRGREDPSLDQVAIEWTGTYGGEPWLLFTEKILLHCHTKRGETPGRLHIHAGLPLGKGMGSSTALVIAIAQAIFGEDCRSEALLIEGIVIPDTAASILR